MSLSNSKFRVRLWSSVLYLLLASRYVSADSSAFVPGTPMLNAPSYVLFDYQSRQVLVSKEPDMRVAPASITKIMTVYAAAHAIQAGLISLQDQVLVSEKAWRMKGSRMFIEVNKTVSVDQLLDGIIVQSGNDASVALAEHVSGSEESFALVMNEYARRLGMSDSKFSNSTGWPDPDNYVTAADVAKLSAALIDEFPLIYSRFAKPDYTFNNINQKNRNRLLKLDTSVDGIKTGFTERAGYCLVSSAIRGEMRLISVVMGTRTPGLRNAESRKLLDYGFRNYESRSLYTEEDVVLEVRAWRSKRETVRLGTLEAVYLPIPRGSFDQLKARSHVNGKVIAPRKIGDEVGWIEVKHFDKEIARIPLRLMDKLEEGTFLSRLYDDVLMFFE